MLYIFNIKSIKNIIMNFIEPNNIEYLIYDNHIYQYLEYKYILEKKKNIDKWVIELLTNF